MTWKVYLTYISYGKLKSLVYLSVKRNAHKSSTNIMFLKDWEVGIYIHKITCINSLISGGN